MNILLTGVVGFIGYHLSLKLLENSKINVFGVDNLNDYYDVNLKKNRLKQLKKFDNFIFKKIDISNNTSLSSSFKKNKYDVVINLAAQAGVRYSIENPLAYINSNIVGFANILENCRHNKINHLVYASTSSVYGANTKMPFSEHDSVNHPLSVYAASKKSNELMAHTYSYLYKLPTTGLRFFTVYGPWGRPDMALFKFTKAIIENRSIDVFNYGKHQRDFTYIDDVVEGIIRVIDRPASRNKNWDSKKPDPGTSKAPWKLYNIGRNYPVDLMDYIKALEKALGKKAKMIMKPMQPGDVPNTFANVDDLIKNFNYKPKTSVDEGVANFVDWYLKYEGSIK